MGLRVEQLAGVVDLGEQGANASDRLSRVGAVAQGRDHVVNRRQHPTTGLVDPLQVGAPWPAVVWRVLEQQLGVAEQVVDRRAEFVTKTAQDVGCHGVFCGHCFRRWEAHDGVCASSVDILSSSRGSSIGLVS